MPGGATSSSQEGALKQGYIRLLPYMLRFLANTRKIIRYHDVTPGSQITWNTAFLAVTSAFQRGGKEEVRYLLNILERIAGIPDDNLEETLKQDRLLLYRDSNDAFRDLLLGRYGKLPLGFPADWVYHSAFGSEADWALKNRTEASPLEFLKEMNIDAERKNLHDLIKRLPTAEELVLYLNHPGDALKTLEFQKQFGDPNNIPLDTWFEGLELRTELEFNDSTGKPHKMMILDISEPRKNGMSVVRYLLDSEVLTYQVKVQEPDTSKGTAYEMAEPGNDFHLASPSKGCLLYTSDAADDLYTV